MGVNINHQNYKGQTAAYSFIPMKMDLLDLHIQHGLNLDLRDNLGRSILSFVCDSFNNNACSFLLEKGANPNIQDSNGMTPLFIAIYNNQLTHAEALLNYGASKDFLTTKNFLLRDEKTSLPIDSSVFDLVDLMYKNYPSEKSSKIRALIEE